MHRWPIVAATLIALAGAAYAQEAKGPAEGSKVVLDNERVRVSQITVKPGAKMRIGDAPEQFLYALTEATLAFVPPGKAGYEVMLHAGEASLLPTSLPEAENVGEKEIRAIIVEMKQPAPRPVAVEAAARGRAKARAARSGGGKAATAKSGTRKAGVKASPPKSAKASPPKSKTKVAGKPSR